MKPSKTILLSFILTISFLFLFSKVFAGGCQDKTCSGTTNCGCTRYKVDPGETITVFEHDICRKVTNSSGYPPTFIPTNSQTEWNLFLQWYPSHITVSDCCTDECSYSGQTEYTCSGNYVQQRTCGYYDSDPCLDWSSWSNYQNCDSYDGCSGTDYYDYYCSGGSCTYTRYPNDSRCAPSCTNECNYSGETRCCNSTQYQTCGNYDSDPCLEWSSCYSCPSGQTCSSGQCQASCSGSLSCQSSTQSSITLSYSYSNCSANTVSLFRGSSRLKTFSGTSESGSYTDSGLSSGTSYTYYLRNGTSASSPLLSSATCSTQAPACTRNSPTVSISPPSQTGSPGDALSYTVSVKNNDSSGCGNSLFKIEPDSCSYPLSCGSTAQDYISPGQTKNFGITVSSNSSASAGSYTFSYKATNLNSGWFAGSSATYQVFALDLPTCPFSDTAGVWGNPDVGWFASANNCSYARCRLGTSCQCERVFEGIQTTSNTFKSYGPTNSRRTELCKIGNQANNIPTCPFSGGTKGTLYITSTSNWWDGWSSNINNWCPVTSSGCLKQRCNILGECHNIQVWSGEYAGECYYSWGVLTSSHACYVCVVK